MLPVVPLKKISPSSLLKDWARVVRKLKHRPTETEYRLHGKHCLATLKQHFPDWGTMLDSFRDFAGGETSWADIFHIIDLEEKSWCVQKPVHRPRSMLKPAPRISYRPACGMALDLVRLPMNP